MPLARALALALAALSFSLAACGDAGGDSSGAPGATRATAGPSATAERFLRAVQGENPDAFADLVTEKALATLEGDGGFELSGARLESFEIGAASVDGDRAEVAVTTVEGGESQSSDVLLRRESAGWRVYGMRVQFGDGSFTVDLEQMAETVGQLGEQLGEQLQEAFSDAQATWEQGGTPGEIAAERAAFQALVAVTPAQHEAAWRVDLDGAGRAALDVLEELLAGTGLAVDAGGHEGALATPITFAFRGVSRVEAVERVAAAAGLRPLWPAASPGATFGDEPPAPDPLSFAAGPRPLPAVATGPFLVEVLRVTENPPNAVGSLALAVRSLGLARGALAFQSEMSEVLRIERVRSAQAQPLGDETVQYMGTPEVRDGYMTYTLDRDLTGLLRGVETIDAIVGEVRLTLPVELEQLSRERGDRKPSALAAGTVTVAEWGEQTRFELKGSESSLENVEVRMSPRKASGDPLGVLYGSSSGWGSELQASLQCPEPPAAVDLKVCTAEVLSYPFTLRGVPLARFAEQPERLEPLAFAGPTPFVVELADRQPGDGDQWEVTLRLRNSSNKDAVSLMVEFAYLDAGGNELDDFPHTLTGDYDFDVGRFGPVAPAGETVEHETLAAFVPAGTAHIRFEVQKAEFQDGTTWER